ncbi:hypothetical protein LU667_17290, partial [Pseudomonas kurunegalensis]|uniref:hypothetical protein n=1 Tax=Pseudomonas kurunegalensis TaxID=485880 RepID=UPI001E64B12D
CESLDSTGGWLSASRFKRCAYSMNSGREVNGFSEVHRLGVKVDFFDFGVGTHHGVQAPERNQEHSIGDRLSALNVGFMERLQ